MSLMGCIEMTQEDERREKERWEEGSCNIPLSRVATWKLTKEAQEQEGCGRYGRKMHPPNMMFLCTSGNKRHARTPVFLYLLRRAILE
jgi:hypothetical protein